MKTIIVTGHGNFATGIKSMLTLVLGEVPNIEFIDFKEGMGSDDLRKTFEACYEKYKASGVIFCADIAGGTPFNQAAMMLHDKGELGVIGGVNIPVILAAIELREEIEDSLELCVQAKDMGLANVSIFGKTEKKKEILSDDGI